MDTKYIIGFLLAIVVIVGGIVIATNGGATKSVLASTYNLDKFAMCLKDQGATFYGAFWCPHCQATKKIFGESKDFLPYVECSTADGQGQLPICKNAGVEGYPTWKFKNGQTIVGELAPTLTPAAGKITLNDLANASDCPIIPLDGTAPIQPQMSAVSTSTTATSTLAPSTAASSAKK